ncbi:Protein SET DOMAIN GROUP 2, C-terminal [Dillenia turbinata]|uniref:Protein SET DOMAIN GROUP 2, C-terminal n=1 Tax=Dillenia turbinata TaxID=194707 RepID=A0AAN8Z046_9MAGN
MGDGGVACVPSQVIMERFTISETFCGGNNGVNSLNCANIDTRRKKKMKKVVKKVIVKTKKVVKSDKGSELGAEKGKTSKEVVGNGEVCNNDDDKQVAKEEVEEGELGSLKWPAGAEVENGEFVTQEKTPGKPSTRKSEIEKGEFIPDKWRKGEAEKGEFVAGKWRKGERNDDGWRREFTPERGRKWENEKSDSWRGYKDELEKGEFNPDRWNVRDEYGYPNKTRRHDAVREKGWREYDRSTPPSIKHFNEDIGQRKEFSRTGGQYGRSLSTWEAGQERNSRICSKIVDDEGVCKDDYSNGKNHGRDFLTGPRSKRHGNDAESGDCRHYREYGDYSTSKSRRLSDDGCRPSYSEHYSRHSVERSYRNNSSSSRFPSSDKYSSRHHESPLPSRVPYDRRGLSPSQSERSPRERSRYHEHQHRDRSPFRHERSPYDRSRCYDYRKKSPTYAGRSPDRTRHHDHRDRTPNYLDRSPHDRARPNYPREPARKSGAGEKRQSQYGNKGQEEKLNQKDGAKDSKILAKELIDKNGLQNENESVEKDASCQPVKEEQGQITNLDCSEPPQSNGVVEDLQSMEEDMDICDTPPHGSVVADSTSGKWFYLDHFGIEQGPSKLSDIKMLVEESFLVPDHLIKHSESDRWVSIEHAASPLVPANFPPVVSDSITQLVSPPEAPGNLLLDTGDSGQPNQVSEEAQGVSSQPVVSEDGRLAAVEPLEDFRIEERIGSLLKGITVVPCQELETLGEILHTTFEHAEWEKWETFRGFTSPRAESGEQREQKTDDDILNYAETTKENDGLRFSASCDKDYPSAHVDPSDWFSGGWSCKGGDWKRNDEAVHDRSFKKKIVLHDGYPLCQMPKSGFEDPRWHRKDDLYHPSFGRRLDLTSWAFSSQDDRNESSAASKFVQNKSVNLRGVKGTMLPVVRINACVVKDSGSFVSESRSKSRGKDRHSSRSTRPHSLIVESKRSCSDVDSLIRALHEQGSRSSPKSITFINIPRDCVCTVEELQLHLGDWYYLDGTGHERGPASFSELQALAVQGVILNSSSVFRKFDRLWVPITSGTEASDNTVKVLHEKSATSGDSSSASTAQPVGGGCVEKMVLSSLFHSMHPQFIGYARGKIHELVMKSYKSREFAAAINEVLDPWIGAKQPKKEMDKHLFSPSTSQSDYFRAAKRARIMADGSDEDNEGEDLLGVQSDSTFEDLCGDSKLQRDESLCSESEVGSWGLLDGHILARVFHFLRADFKSLAFVASTCKHWKAVVRFYRDISVQVDFSEFGSRCNDSIILNVMNGYKKEKITSMVLVNCTNITSSVLEECIRSFPSVSCIDIRGCSQFEDLACKFPNVNWVNSRNLHGRKISEDSLSKLSSLKQITEKTSTNYRSSKGIGSHVDDSNELRDYFEMVDKRVSASQSFQQSLYKRSKLFNTKRTSSILSRDARMRRLALKRSENGYKRMEEFLAFCLKDIMKENTFDFFVPKVAEIENKMKNGYYIGHGLSSVKEDISRMCRDAIKAKNRGEAGDMNHIINLFIKLAICLEESAKSSYGREQLMKAWKDSSSANFCSALAQDKKKHSKFVTDRKYRSIGTMFSNGDTDYGYTSDREIRRRLSKLNRKSLKSGSETSDDQSSEDTRSDSESTVLDSESDLDLHSEAGGRDSRLEGFFMEDESLDLTEDREWGARMTKASLVPPVTRKYEVIDQYVVVADEEEVRKKMHVSLPKDYLEKLNAVKNGTEESELEIPEVKDYKPRKQLGNEVLEQEVYGIDPYTHNLLLDSMPEEPDWPLLDKHLFIEDVLLRVLNKQVRCFTGTGNTPMTYPLQPVIEEILKKAEEEHDLRTVKLCQSILKSIDNRTDDNYVAYRKGLGVVCNKEEGFGEDDFVVEFLGEVYPAWKWFEKQDGIRSLQKNSEDPAPEFYNIYLERPKGDADGYDIVVVDAMHKANYASRICHSCRPNCEAKVTAVDGQYQIGIYSVRPIRYGEEITFDYNSVTESKEEYEASVCLCGSQVCRGSYLNLTGEGAFLKVLKEWHGVLDRHHLMLEACELNSVSEQDYIDLGRAGMGSCLLGGLPDWLIAYSARLVRFINFERTKLPDEILRHNMEEKRKFFADICYEVEKNDAEIQAEGVFNQRLQNLALSLDKVRYVMGCIFGDPRKAPPPLERLSPEEAVSFLWKGEGSLVQDLLQSMAPHMEEDVLNDFKSKIDARDPSGSANIQKELQKSLIWLRDEVRDLQCTYKCRHDAAADLIHIYAYTKCFFRIREYKSVTSPPVYISPLDLGPRYSDKFGSGVQEYHKTYGENYCLGQLIYWYNQTNAEPDSNPIRASKGCLSLPDIGSFYAKLNRPSRHRVYGPRTVKFMLARMEKQPQRPWPKERIWSFKNSPKIFGSPMLDAIMNNCPIDKEMVTWLKNRPPIYQAMWDR